MTENYHNIVIITNELNEQGTKIIKESLERFDGRVKVCLLQVIPKVPNVYFQLPSLVGLENELYNEALIKLKGIAEALQLSHIDLVVRSGGMKTEAQRFAKHLNTKFIIYGEHVPEPLSDRLSAAFNQIVAKAKECIATLTQAKPAVEPYFYQLYNS